MKLVIDHSKCSQDGLCAADCPMYIIDPKGDGGFPQLMPGSEDKCMTCGHCVAICPHGALSHSSVPLEACPVIDKDLKLDWPAAVQFLRSRRSARVFKNRPVGRETMTELIEAARYAPQSANRQAIKWLVYDDPAVLRSFAEMSIDYMRHQIAIEPDEWCNFVLGAWDSENKDAVLRSAPMVAIATAPDSAPNGWADCIIALTYLELAALPLGLGTCWAGDLYGAIKDWPALNKAVDLPPGHSWFYPILIGYPKVKYQRLPARKNAKIQWR